MLTRTLHITAGAAILAVAVGCSPTQTPQPNDQSFSAYQEQELESERQDFIADTKQRIEKIDNDIARLETRLTHEAQYVDAEKRADWSQRLWELKQESQRLKAQATRAENANAAEWSEMRGNIAYGVDTLQAGMSKIADEIVGVFSGDDEPVAKQEQRSQTEAQGQPAKMDNLCALDVAGSDAEVQVLQNRVAVTVTSDDPSDVEALEEGAQQIVNHNTYPSLESNEQGQTKILQVRTWLEMVDGGVRVMFAPQDPTELETLQAAVERDAEQLGEGNCEARPVITMRDTAADLRAGR